MQFMKIQTKIYEALLHMKLSDHLRRSQTTETRHWPAHSKKNRALNHAEIQHMLQFLHFKERMKFCRVCKLWKKVIEKTKIRHAVTMDEFTNISKESNIFCFAPPYATFCFLFSFSFFEKNAWGPQMWQYDKTFLKIKKQKS